VSPSQNFWEELFVPAGNERSSTVIEMRLLRKNGRPLLLLPKQTAAAAATFELYPAQTAKARLARAGLQLLARFGLGPGEKVSVRISPEDKFAQFIRARANVDSSLIPTFGVLAGNPATPGQRFLVLAFDGDERPVSAIKTGASAAARELMHNEIRFLQSAPPKMPGLPRVQATIESENLSALALDYYAGASPRGNDAHELGQLLSSWIDSSTRLQVKEIPVWQTLERTLSSGEIGGLERIRGASVHPVVQHGDFAPWNIKVSANGTWTVLDWERGQLQGIPGWDWFHYQLQNAILVGGQTGQELVNAAEEVVQAEAFQDYAGKTEIKGFERMLLRAYLLHIIHVVKPAEGLSQARELVQSFSHT
jgi:hypothetical protein